ncbi:GON1 protein, partial [Cisticola juncidis]|nr:GON1 protein [Cisticola juncidis]
MQQPRRVVACALLCVLSVGLCLAQHWSFGLQPGGKRSTQALLGPLQEIPNEMENLEKLQQSSCQGWEQSSIRDLQEAVERLVEGEGRRKEI